MMATEKIENLTVMSIYLGMDQRFKKSNLGEGKKYRPSDYFLVFTVVSNRF